MALLVRVDEASDLGLFDTDILSAKARAAGWNLAICRDLFIHHFGTWTFAHGAGAALVGQRCAAVPQCTPSVPGQA